MRSNSITILLLMNAFAFADICDSIPEAPEREKGKIITGTALCVAGFVAPLLMMANYSLSATNPERGTTIAIGITTFAAFIAPGFGAQIFSPFSAHLISLFVVVLQNSNCHMQG